MEPGIYMVAVKIDSQSDKLLGSPYGISQNFRKVRVIVEPSLKTEQAGGKTTITFYGNDPNDETYGQIYGTKRYYPVSWSAGDKNGAFTAKGGVYTAECEANGEGSVTCDVKIWTGYKWEDAEQESFSVKLPEVPVSTARDSAPAKEPSHGGIPAWAWICIAVAAVATVVIVLARKKKK